MSNEEFMVLGIVLIALGLILAGFALVRIGRAAEKTDG